MMAQSIRTFSQPVSKDTTLEIGFLDLQENSQVTSVILIINSHSSHPSYRHITRKVLRTQRLREFCHYAMIDYLGMCSDIDETEDLNRAI